MTSETLIVQKYIETPLLIYQTKFDIRQWFLVTGWSPLTIWWYNDSYIRFCSQKFTLNDFNESIHLSNNSIQHKYQNGSRSNKLPSNNMWHWQYFEKYLNDNNYTEGWKKKILPSMKDIIIDVLLCSQEDVEDRKNSFELYGADFMVTANDLRTWLIEINSSPCMAASTDVTAKLTKSVLGDVFKVLLDYPEDIYCDTGQFELLFKQSPFTKPVLPSGDKLNISGIAIKKPTVYPQFNKRESLSPKKEPVRCDKSILRNKLRKVIENNGSCSEANSLTGDNDQLFLYPICKRLKEHKDDEGNNRKRRTQSKLLNNARNSLTRIVKPVLATEMSKGVNSYALSYQILSNSNRDAVYRQSYRQFSKSDKKENHCKSSDMTSFLEKKLNNWNQRQRKLRSSSTMVKLNRYIS